MTFGRRKRSFILFLATTAVITLLLRQAPVGTTAFVVPHQPQRHPERIRRSRQTSSLLILHDIPALLSNLLTQPRTAVDSNHMIMAVPPPVVDTTTYSNDHATQRILLENGMTMLVNTSSKPGNYAQAATTLFVNMLTPASILAAAMISLGMKKPFELSDEMKSNENIKTHIESLRRAYIVVTMISFCSELLAVMWGTVAVNQLTEQMVLPSESVWQLIQRDVDLEWAAVNSHFVVGLIGFMYMVGIRGYVMLMAAGASESLIVSVLSGVGAALLLMVSIVNRGVEAGGGDGVGYGNTILDLFGHYISLLYERAKGGAEAMVVDVTAPPPSVGPLGLSAIVLEITSVGFALFAILSPVFNDAAESSSEESNILLDNTQDSHVATVNGTATATELTTTTNQEQPAVTASPINPKDADLPTSPSS